MDAASERTGTYLQRVSGDGFRHVSGSINIASYRQCKGCRKLSKVNGTAVIINIYSNVIIVILTY